MYINAFFFVSKTTPKPAITPDHPYCAAAVGTSVQILYKKESIFHKHVSRKLSTPERVTSYAAFVVAPLQVRVVFAECPPTTSAPVFVAVSQTSRSLRHCLPAKPHSCSVFFLTLPLNSTVVSTVTQTNTFWRYHDSLTQRRLGRCPRQVGRFKADSPFFCY